ALGSELPAGVSLTSAHLELAIDLSKLVSIGGTFSTADAVSLTLSGVLGGINILGLLGIGFSLRRRLDILGEVEQHLGLTLIGGNGAATLTGLHHDHTWP